MLNKTSVELAKRFIKEVSPEVRGGDILLGFEEMREKRHIMSLKMYEAQANEALALHVLKTASSIEEIGKERARVIANRALSYANERDGIFTSPQLQIASPETHINFPKQGIIFEERKSA